MAIHRFPDKEGGELVSYINDARLRPWAEKSIQLLKCFSELKIWETQYKGKGVANTCWYVGLRSQQKPYLLNFTMIPSNLNVEFRFSHYLPKEDFERLKWQNSSWRYAGVTNYGADNISGFIHRYLSNVRADLLNGSLRQGGKSFAETLLFRSLLEIYRDAHILENTRPDNLRSKKNIPLELDLYIPELRIAIELQGPQHFKEIYGPNISLQSNDLRKKKWCRDNNIKFIWINWDGFNKNLLRLSFAQRTERLRQIINSLIEREEWFLWWKNEISFHYE